MENGPIFLVGTKRIGRLLLGGRGLVGPLVGFSLMAANLSGTSYYGLAGSGYDDAVAVWNYEWMATLVTLAMIWIFR